MAETLGDRIARLRKAKGLNIGELAEAVTGSGRYQTVSDWEQDRRLPSIENYLNLCEVLEIDPHTMWHGEDRQTHDDPALSGLVAEMRRTVQNLVDDPTIPRAIKIDLLTDGALFLRGEKVRPRE